MTRQNHSHHQRMSSVTVTQFGALDKEAWDQFVLSSKNGTFLFLRDYMEYHSDRFQDHSLMFRNSARELIALLPAHREDDCLASHRGLTYGGIISGESMGILQMHAVFEALRRYLLASGFNVLFYKTIPHIYHRLPAQEDLHALLANGARLLRRDVLTVLASEGRVPLHRDRRAGIARALRAGLRVERSHDFARFWGILEKVLGDKFGSKPTHAAQEIELLRSRFPENIRLHVCRDGDEVVAGEVLFDTPRVVKLQYGCASAEGSRVGAQDLLISHIIEEYRHRPFLDFGSSIASDGASLKAGLIGQKEGFGGRTVCHDSYELRP